MEKCPSGPSLAGWAAFRAGLKVSDWCLTNAVGVQELKGDASQLLRSGMWKYRSGLSHKRMLRFEGYEDLEDARHHKMQALWKVASPQVEAWAQLFLSHRFR